MTDTATLKELLARVEKAEGAEPLVDQAIYEALLPADAARFDELPAERQMELAKWAWRRRDYTASLDAAVALVERVLPGWSWRVGNLQSGKAFCQLGTSRREIIAATPALAVLVAFLSELIAQQENTGGHNN